MTRRLATLPSLLLVLVALGCPTPPPRDGGPSDAGAGDDGGAPPDAGVDAGALDDAGPDDAGSDDAGRGDAGVGDDAGPGDAGLDAGAGDDGGDIDDAGPDDAGSDDAGTVDAGPIPCAVGGALGTCGPVTTCEGVSWLGTCGPGPAEQCCAADVLATCSVDGAPGACIDVASCGAPLVATPGRCPGPAAIQCCTDPSLACDPELPPLANDGLDVVEELFDATCPRGMVRAGATCIDRYEASLLVIDGNGDVLATHSPYAHPTTTAVRAVSLALAIPQAYIDGATAAVACANAGKRLCLDDEWLAACRGSSLHVYPYGDTRIPGACNDARASHPAIEYFGTTEAWIWSELGNSCIAQLPSGLAPTGTHPACASDDGVMDLMGNLHEWTADPAGTFRGGFYVDTVLNGEGCLYATTAHDVAHWDYSTGFRCCADPQ